MALLNEGHWNWARWVIVRCLNKEENVKLAIFCAKEVLPIFEAKFPDDKRPRKAIKAAIAWCKKPCEETHSVTANAAVAAYAAADDAYAASTYAAAANATANAAAAAATAASAASATDDAYAAATAAYADAANAAAAAADDPYAAYDATYGGDVARKNIQKKCLLYGIELVRHRCGDQNTNPR
jgi:hypothetical protein